MKTLLQFSAILVEGLIFSPLITYVYYYYKVRAFRPMGCTSPPVPLRRRLVGSPPLGFGAPHDGDVRAVRASFAGVFRCVSVCFCVYVSFHVRLNALFQSICLLVWRNNSCLQPSNGEFARCALFAFQRSQ